MSFSPIPPDPYETLGVDKDADITAIRTARRKLALKYHPDKKDEAERAKATDEFQKIQQAYEILSDPEKRRHYDNKVNQAKRMKEDLMREPAIRPMPYPMRPGPPSASPREFRDGTYFEERVPSNSFFDSHEHFDDPLPRASTRKYDDYERKPAPRPSEKDRKPSGSKWNAPVSGMSFDMAFNLKKRANQAKERVQEKAKVRESQTAKAKARDKDEKRERSEKQSRRAFVVDAESSDSDDVPYVKVAPTPSTPKPSPKPSQRAESRLKSPERSRSYRDDDEENYNDPWEPRHKEAREYIFNSQDRPSMGRSESDAHRYWDGDDRAPGRRSGSDSDRRPRSSKGRRPDVEIPKTRSSPSVPTHTSAPSNLRPFIEEREPTSTRANTYSSKDRDRDRDREREHRRDIPAFSRSNTMPAVGLSRKDTAPSKGSHLKHSETQDSGYSSSSPHTPEMPSHSPTREHMRQSSKIYQIVTPRSDDENPRGHRTILIDEEDKHRRYSSPPRERDRRDRPERSDRPKGSGEARTRPGRASGQSSGDVRPTSIRSESHRHTQSGSPRESPPVSRHSSGRGKLFGEVDIEEREPAPYSRRYAPEHVTMSPRIDIDNVNHGPYRRRDALDEQDHVPGSKYRQELRQPTSGRRGSVY